MHSMRDASAQTHCVTISCLYETTESGECFGGELF
jgi:hypothetical protein